MKQLLSYWSFDLSSLVLVLMIVLFGIITKSFSKKSIALSVFILLTICFFSSLHILSSHYLFSAHMIVHVVLLLCIGPLIVAGLSADQKRFHGFFLFLKRHPMPSWLTGVGVMWFWHIPLIFNSSMSSMHDNSLHIVPVIEASSLIIAGVLFSAPVIHPNKGYRIDALSGVVYLFTACIGCSLLGLLITFAPTGMYQHFLSMHDNYGLNKIILRSGITQSTDQQAAGLIMWVPCCLIYVTGIMYLLVQWFKQKEVIALEKQL
jgi:cytochrome c oxidase assembly factor CtaG